MTIEALDNIACESAPVAESHLANKAYVDAAVAAGAGTASVSGDNVVSIPAHSLISCDIPPTDDSHLVNKGYVDAAVAAAGTATPTEETAGLGKVVNVTTLSDAASHTGTSLRDAITAVTNKAAILIKFSVSGTITLEQGEIELPVGNFTLDGENKITISGGDVSRLFTIRGGSVLSLKNLVIAGGNGVGSASSQVYGGAIHFSGNGVLFARNVTFKDNFINGSANNIYGGAVCVVNNGRADFKNCIFKDNSVTSSGSTARGGAVYSNSQYVKFEDCTFTGNTVAGPTTSRGGALDLVGGIIRNCTFTGNTISTGSTQSGGAVYVNGGAVYINGCEFTENSVGDSSTSCIGGAVQINSAIVSEIADCTFTANTGRYGAALAFAGANTGQYDNHVYRCVFDGNGASSSNNRGSALYFYYISAAIEDCEFKNHAVGASSGLIYVYGYTNGIFTVTFNRCKFTGNSSSATTTGLVYCANVSQVYLYNCVFTGNSFTATSGNHKCVYTTGSGSWAYIYNCTFTNNTNAGGVFYAAAGGVDIYNSVEYGNGSGSGKNSSATVNAAKFLSDQSTSVGRDLAYDSTKPLFAADGFTPAASSQVIDKGNNNYVMTAYDLPGKTRKVGTAVDLGAVEYQGV